MKPSARLCQQRQQLKLLNQNSNKHDVNKKKCQDVEIVITVSGVYFRKGTQTPRSKSSCSMALVDLLRFNGLVSLEERLPPEVGVTAAAFMLLSVELRAAVEKNESLGILCKRAWLWLLDKQ